MKELKKGEQAYCSYCGEPTFPTVKLGDMVITECFMDGNLQIFKIIDEEDPEGLVTKQ